MKKYLCYCFEHTEEDIRNDLVRHAGHSVILEQIVVAKKEGTCQCTDKHPEGR